MIEVATSLITKLSELQIEHQHFTHPAVFSTADVHLLPEQLPGVDTKNLFLRDDKRSRYILVCVRAETRVDLKALGLSLGIKGTTFASPEDMLEMLALTPGSVCLFGLMNDTNRRVEGFLDESIDPDDTMQNHPLINTATITLKTSDMQRFCESMSHPLRRIPIPARS
jgi:Ala-tRNA(Pro) deacylase